MLPNKEEFFRKYYLLITTLFVSAVYLFTIAPSVVQIDSGELAAVQTTMGIAHPTGYPIFTLTGYLFLKLPLPFTKIFQANLLALVCCSLGVFLFIKSALVILSNITFGVESHKKKSKPSVVESSEKN